MRRALFVVALVLLCAVVVPGALAHSEDDENPGDNIIYHTGTYEELGTLIKELEKRGVPLKKSQEAEKPVASPPKAAPKKTEAKKPKAKSSEPTVRKIIEGASPTGPTTSEKRKNQIKFEHCRRIIQNSPATLYPTLKKEGKPTIIHNTPLTTTWPAFDTWTFEYFAERWGASHAMGPISVSNGTRASGMHEAVLIYNNRTEYTAWPGVPKATKETAMNLGTFFSGQCQKQTEDTWWWARAMFTLNDSLVESQVSPLDYFVDPTSLNKTEPLASMVTSSMNGKFQLHYETDDMWIVNIYQRQQVLLFSPEEMQKLYLFPWTHPYRRRSQVLPLTEANEARFPGISNVTGLEALLEPQEVLFIPKYWGYHIINVAPSISLHVVSPDKLQKSRGQWDFNKNLVGLSHLEPAKRLTAAIFAIRRVLQPLLDMDNWEHPYPEIEGDDPPSTYEMTFDNKVLRAFIRKHIQQRYSKLPDYRTAKHRAHSPSKKELFEQIKSECREARTTGKLEPIEHARFAATLDGVVYNLYQHQDLSIRHLMMHDWLDFIAWSAYGDHNLIEAFLMRCF